MHMSGKNLLPMAQTLIGTLNLKFLKVIWNRKNWISKSYRFFGTPCIRTFVKAIPENARKSTSNIRRCQISLLPCIPSSTAMERSFIVQRSCTTWTILKLIKCNCKSDCASNSNCSCQKNNLQSTPMCGACKGVSCCNQQGIDNNWPIISTGANEGEWLFLSVSVLKNIVMRNWCKLLWNEWLIRFWNLRISCQLYRFFLP